MLPNVYSIHEANVRISNLIPFSANTPRPYQILDKSQKFTISYIYISCKLGKLDFRCRPEIARAGTPFWNIHTSWNSGKLTTPIFGPPQAALSGLLSGAGKLGASRLSVVVIFWQQIPPNGVLNFLPAGCIQYTSCKHLTFFQIYAIIFM